MPKKKGVRANLEMRHARQTAKLPLENAAYLAGIRPEFWAMYEAGTQDPTLRHAFRISWVLGLPIEEIFRNIAEDEINQFDADVEFLRKLYVSRA